MAHALTHRDDLFSTIFAAFPTLGYCKPESFGRPWVFWSHDDSDPSTIQERLRYAFSNLEIRCLDGLIQFWAPVTTSSAPLLKTSHQPFAIANPDELTMKYMLRSLNHQYNVELEYHGACSAFINQMPELLLDMRVHKMGPMRYYALECGLMCSFVLPVFVLHRSICTGVVECYTKRPDNLLVYFIKVNAALEKEGFKTFYGQNRLLYKTMPIIERVRDEIDLALAVILESYNIGFAQVWISCENELHISSTKQMLGLKLIGRRCGLPNDEFPNYKDLDWYDEVCDMFPLKVGKGLVGQTLENHVPYFIENISKLGSDEPLRLLRHSEEYSCFVICLRSNNLDYAFEFLWHQHINCNTLFGSLVLALKRCLGGFTYASGGELGEELRIRQVDNHTIIRSFKIFERNKPYPSLQFSEKRRPVGKQQDPQDVNVSLRKVNGSRAIQDSLIIKGDGDGETILTVTAQYENDAIKFNLPMSYATFVGIKLKLAKRFNLDPVGYKLKYLAEDGNWILMFSDEDMRQCIKKQGTLKSTKIQLLCEI